MFKIFKGPTGCIDVAFQSGDQVDHIPAAVYGLQINVPVQGPIQIHLHRISDEFAMPQQRYGEHDAMVRTVTDDYDRINPPYGAIAQGLKGAGKTMLFHDVSNRLIRKGLPVLMVEAQYPIGLLRQALAVIGPCVMFFDEFGKYYTDVDIRNQLLPLFADPLYKGVLFLLTANTTTELNEYLLDRPGRMRYRFTMNSVSSFAVADFCKKNRIEPKRAAWMHSFRHELTFDILDALTVSLREATSFMDFRRRATWLNVPAPRPQRISVRSISLRDPIDPDPAKRKVEEATGYLDDKFIYLTAVDGGGNKYEEAIQYFTDDGEWLLVDGVSFASDKFHVSFDISPFFCSEAQLVPGTAFFADVSMFSDMRSVEMEGTGLMERYQTAPSKSKDKDKAPAGIGQVVFSAQIPGLSWDPGMGDGSSVVSDEKARAEKGGDIPY